MADSCFVAVLTESIAAPTVSMGLRVWANLMVHIGACQHPILDDGLYAGTSRIGGLYSRSTRPPWELHPSRWAIRVALPCVFRGPLRAKEWPWARGGLGWRTPFLGSATKPTEGQSTTLVPESLASSGRSGRSVERLLCCWLLAPRVVLLSLGKYGGQLNA